MYPILSSKQTTHTHTYLNSIKLHRLCTYHTHIPYTPRYKPVIKFISRNMISEEELLDCGTSDDITLVRNSFILVANVFMHSTHHVYECTQINTQI